MTSEPKRWIIIIIGPPGSGKGTQAELLADDLGLYNFETSKIIEEKFATSMDDPIVQRQKKLYDAGELIDPPVVLQWVLEKVRSLAVDHCGIVFQGSPRSVLEAEGELPVFVEHYGRDNIKIFHLNLNEEMSVRRNVGRRVCKANRHPIPDLPEYRDLTTCPIDGSKLVHRSLDTEKTMRERYQTYLEETVPVLDFFRKNGYRVIEINGEQSIEIVHEEIMKTLNKTHCAGHAKMPL